MSTRFTAIVDRLQQDEYTGENRCIPCTIVNVIIALAASIAVALRSRRLGALTFGLSLLAVYLRGYLVPGTPTLTTRYLPDDVLAAFDKAPREPRTGTTIEPTAVGDSLGDDGDESDDSDAGDGDADDELAFIEELERQRENAVDPERFLLEVDAVGPCDDVDDLCLTDAFETRVERELDRHEGETPDEATVADLFDVETDAVTDENRDYPAFNIYRRIYKWPAEAALVADVAIDRALEAQTDRWAEVPPGQRLELLEVLRSFLETCPNCGGAITLGDETVESCCRSYEVRALECVDCGAPLLEFDPKEVGGHDGGIEP